jgi:hypothetical protein
MDDDTPDYILKAKLPSQKDRRFPPRVRRPGPPEGEDYFTLSAKHGAPHGSFDRDREFTYRG